MTLSQSQRLFARIIMEIMANGKLEETTVFLGGKDEGKTWLMRKLEEYLRHNKAGSLEHFETWLDMDKAQAPVLPRVYNATAMYLHENYGITEERRLVLSAMMNKLNDVKATTISPVWYRIRTIAEFCDTHEEFMWCTVTDIMYLCKSKTSKLL